MRLTNSQISGVREARRLKNGQRCELCSGPLPATKAVLDHCHKRGWVRGTICRGCNSLLGKVENNAGRYGVTNLSAFLHGAASYLQRNETWHTGLIHPKHLTEDEKRLKRNAAAVKRRAVKKKA